MVKKENFGFSKQTKIITIYFLNDLDKNVVADVNKFFNSTKLVAFETKLIPLRTPVFINKEIIK